MRRYRNKYENISNNDSEEEKAYISGKSPSYQVTREYQHKQLPNGYEKSRHITQKMQYGDPNGKNGKISSKSEKFYTFYTESSSPKVNFNSKNTAKNYMDKRAFTPSRFGHNKINIEKSNYNIEDNEYISELREEYSNPMMNNRVNIRKKVYRGNQTPQPYRTNNEYQEYKNNEDEEFLDNYGYHETKNIKDKSHKKYDSITHITGYSNLIPLNRLKQCGRIESINFSSRKEQENKPNFKDAIEKVRELQRGKREYDEFMKKLGRDNDNNNEDKIENFKREQLRQQEIREEKIRLERLRQERIREEQMRNEKMRQERIRIEQIRKNEEIMRDKINNDKKRQEELRQIKIREEKIRQERIRQEKIRQEKIRQEQIKRDKIKQQEKINQDKIRLEKIKQERIKQEERAKNKSKPKAETYKKIVVNTEVVSTARSDSVKKQFKAHSGRYKYKENINEDINNYRNNSNLKEPNNIAKKETVYKNKKIKKETNKSYSKLPIKININTTTQSYTRNHSSKNLKTTTDYSVKNKTNNIDKNKIENYRIKTNKTTITSTSNNLGEGRRNSYRSNNTSINTDKNKSTKNYVSNYTKKSYTSTYSNINNKNTYPDRSNNNYKRSMVKVSEKTASLNYPNPHIKVDTYGPKYTGEQYHRDYINIENTKYGKIANHIHTGLSKDGQYLISMTSAQKLPDENAIYGQNEKDVEEIVSTVREKKKNLGDNYAFYESKHLQKPDNSSYTIHKRFGERTIFGKEKYETRKVRHYKIKSDDEGKYLDYNEGGYNDDNNYEYNSNNQMNECNCDCGCVQRGNTDVEYDNVNFDYSPDSPEGPVGQEEEYENRVEEYNYESY